MSKITEKEEKVFAAITAAKLDYAHQGPCSSLTCEEQASGEIRIYDDYESVIVPVEEALEALAAAEKSEDPYKTFWTAICGVE